MSRIGGNPGKDIGQPGLRIHTIHFCRDDEAIHGSRPSSAAIGPAEQPRLSSERDASEPPFGGIIGEAHAPVFEEQGEARPALQDVV